MFIEAQTVLEELSVRDIVTWSTLIAGYTEEGHGEEALKCFDLMLSEGLSPNAVTLLCCLKACGIRQDLEKGKQIHDEIVGGCFLEKDIVLGTALVDMYVRCGVLCKAQGVLDSLPVRDTVSWSAIIKGYSEQGQYHEALGSFSRLQSEGLSPDAITFICILNVYGILGSLDKGKEIHEMIVTMGLLERNDIILANALAAMYSKCGVLEKAEQVLEELPNRDVASWNTLISGYVQQGQNEKALSCYERIQNDCLSPDTVTFMCMLKACGSIRALAKGKQIHSEIVRIGLLNKETVLRNALVDMYAKCGMLEKARHLVEGLSIRDIIAWNSLIGGYTQQGQCDEALNTFEQLQREGLLPDAVTFTCILKACSSIGVSERGKRIHDKVSRVHSLKKDPVLGTTLVNMYAKCGLVSKAREVLEELHTRDIVSWNALLWGYAQQQQGLDVMKCVECLQYEGLSPNEVTFVCALSACGRSGLLSEAEILFSCMTVAPRLEHNSCMVITFGRAGYFERAATLFKGVSASAKAAIWFAILSACWRWGHTRLGRLAFDQTIQPNDCDPLVSIDLMNSMKDVKLLASNYDSNNSDAVYAFSCH
jgi:pentatricopeptide repeat protein